MTRNDKETVASVSYMEAYFQGRWVYLPIPYVPQEASVERVQASDLCVPVPQRNCDGARGKIVSAITEIIDPEAIPGRKLRELCRHNDIPLAWVSNKPCHTNRRFSGTGIATGCRNRKFISLTPPEFRRFIRALRPLHDQAVLIAQIIWFLNRAIGSSIPLEALLRVKVNAIAQENDPSKWIRLSYFYNGTSHLTVWCLPEYLWNRLCCQVTDHSYIIFSNKNGGPLLVCDLDRVFAQAGKLAGIKGRVTSLSLRCDKRLKMKSVLKRADIDSGADLSEISVLEWKAIVSAILDLSQKRGRKSKYDARDVLNCIFLHLREGRSIRYASGRMSIPEDVVESQFRRWRASGMIARILKARNKV